MTCLEMLTQKVKDLYESKNPNRTDWADWLYENHIFVVVDYAQKYSKRFGIDNDLAAAASMLHDIGDAVTHRFSDDHGVKSEEIARELLTDSGYTLEEIAIIVDDAMKFHSCREGKLPQTEEGKIMAMADAVAHLATNYYPETTTMLAEETSPEKARTWAHEKIERDFTTKIFFDDVREDVREAYEGLPDQLAHIA